MHESRSRGKERDRDTTSRIKTAITYKWTVDGTIRITMQVDSLDATYAPVKQQDQNGLKIPRRVSQITFITIRHILSF